MDVASVISAVSATTGTVLVAISLYVTGRRDQARWTRETLLDTCQTFLNASFDTTSAAKHLSGFSPGPRPPTPEEVTHRISEAYATKNSLLTRLRLLADTDLVEAASDLHAQDDRFVALMHKGATPEEYEQARLEIHRWRERFVIASRRMLKVPGAVAAVRNVSSVPPT